MREIKFRRWSLHFRKMLEVVDTPAYRLNEVQDDFIYMQFTGLRDKNGRPIYEGDILQPATMNDGNLNYWDMKDGQAVKRSAVVNFDSNYASFNIPLPPSDFEVIGNIHENPDLLKAPAHE